MVVDEVLGAVHDLVEGLRDERFAAGVLELEGISVVVVFVAELDAVAEVPDLTLLESVADAVLDPEVVILGVVHLAEDDGLLHEARVVESDLAEQVLDEVLAALLLEEAGLEFSREARDLADFREDPSLELGGEGGDLGVPLRVDVLEETEFVLGYFLAVLGEFDPFLEGEGVLVVEHEGEADDLLDLAVLLEQAHLKLFFDLVVVEDLDVGPDVLVVDEDGALAVGLALARAAMFHPLFVRELVLVAVVLAEALIGIESLLLEVEVEFGDLSVSGGDLATRHVVVVVNPGDVLDLAVLAFYEVLLDSRELEDLARVLFVGWVDDLALEFLDLLRLFVE